jgi:exodeoxyribonuclease VII small subunit
MMSSSARQAVSLRRTRLVVVAAAGSGGDAETGKPAAETATAKLERLPYEQARDELTELVKRLEAGGLTLEQSLRLWERGEELAGICEEWLEGARARLATALARHNKSGETPGAPF